MASLRLLTRLFPLRASGWSRLYSNKQSTVGFIGLGNMGWPMANNLLKKGHKLVVYDLVEAYVDTAIATGAIAADSPAQVVSQADVVVTMLPGNTHVKDCYTGSHGLLQAATQQNLFIDCSTVDQSTVQEVSSKTTLIGCNFIDAPVSGGVGGANKATLVFMVGGEKKCYEQAVPILECMGRSAIYCGGHGAGQAAKLCNNMLLAINTIGTCEALQLGINLGLDPKVLTAIISIASGRCWTVDTYNPCPGVMEGVPSSNNYEGGFRAHLMAKDLQLAMVAAGSSKSLTPMGSLASQLFQLLCEQGHSERDFTAMFKFLEKKTK